MKKQTEYVDVHKYVEESDLTSYYISVLSVSLYSPPLRLENRYFHGNG